MSDNEIVKKQTIKFFNFELDASNLKKILDFYAWFNVIDLILLIILHFFLLPDILSQPEQVATSYLFNCILYVRAVCFIYFFRYSPYLYGIFIILGIFLLTTYNLKLKGMVGDINLIETLKEIKFEGERCYLILADYIFDSIYNEVNIIFGSIVMFYFSYSYKKLIKCSCKISGSLICAKE